MFIFLNKSSGMHFYFLCIPLFSFILLQEYHHWFNILITGLSVTAFFLIEMNIIGGFLSDLSLKQLTLLHITGILGLLLIIFSTVIHYSVALHQVRFIHIPSI